LNLLSNARDAIVSHQERLDDDLEGWITIAINQDGGARTLRISVEDNGGGIPTEVLPHIFAPFVTTKESGKGTGLGLSISYGIIESMAGTIEAFNIEDGARFEIILPIVDKEHDWAASAALVTHNAAKILVVDDEITAANSLSDFVQEMGYLVYTAYNGEEAIQIFKSDPTDAVITDLRMPVMGGDELIVKLRALSPTLPIFAMTGYREVGEDDAQINQDQQTQGASELWRKPLSLEEVAQRLQSVCGPGMPRHEI
ncbi:MAG: response regulator, partial [Magnetovibrio sp.]|nr:response regulator [Magnetovibrio sp.]